MHNRKYIRNKTFNRRLNLSLYVCFKYFHLFGIRLVSRAKYSMKKRRFFVELCNCQQTHLISVTGLQITTWFRRKAIYFFTHKVLKNETLVWNLFLHILPQELTEQLKQELVVERSKVEALQDASNKLKEQVCYYSLYNMYFRYSIRLPWSFFLLLEVRILKVVISRKIKTIFNSIETIKNIPKWF